MAQYQEESIPLTSRVDVGLLEDLEWLEKPASAKTSTTDMWTNGFSNLWQWTMCIGRFVLPRFLTGDLPDSKGRSTTAYLDALRGWAAWNVFNYHHICLLNTHFSKYNFLWAGKPGVLLFFVISGYALSHGFMSKTEAEIILPKLASSIFRRYLRLFLPVFLATFLTMICVATGIVPHESMLSPLESSFGRLFMHWLQTSFELANPFSPVAGYHTAHVWFGFQMWTIPVEFRGSMILFLYLAMSYRLSKAKRLSLIAIATPALYYWDAVYVSLFMFGSALALTEPTTSIELPLSSLDRTGPWQWMARIYHNHRDVIVLPLFVIAAWFYHVPYHFPVLTTPDVYFPWQYLTSYPITPPPPADQKLDEMTAHKQEVDREHVIQIFSGIASVVIIFCLQRSRYLRWPFETRIMLYLGQISFGLYLTHLTVIFSLYHNFIQPWRAAKGIESFWMTWNGWFVTYLALLVVAITVADWFERADAVIQRQVKWLWNWLSLKE
ncbi:Hypothetical protein D9617_13g100450 [Elsinoe fawcettii]|nr:Hypothetical protein D9617_13g100450 [Elsinoe fawcettii]